MYSETKSNCLPTVFRGPLRVEHLGDRLDVFRLVVHADEEGDFDVGADIVPADQAVFVFAGDFDPLHRQVHDLGFLDQRDDDHAVARADRQTFQAGTHDGFFRTGFSVEPGKHHREADEAHEKDANAHQNFKHCYTFCFARLTK